MTECDHMLTELEEKILKWQSARECGEKDDASDREKADLKIAEEEYLGLQQRVRKYRSLRRVQSKRRIGWRGLSTIALLPNASFPSMANRRARSGITGCRLPAP